MSNFQWHMLWASCIKSIIMGDVFAGDDALTISAQHTVNWCQFLTLKTFDVSEEVSTPCGGRYKTHTDHSLHKSWNNSACYFCTCLNSSTVNSFLQGVPIRMQTNYMYLSSGCLNTFTLPAHLRAPVFQANFTLSFKKRSHSSLMPLDLPSGETRAHFYWEQVKSD